MPLRIRISGLLSILAMCAGCMAAVPLDDGDPARRDSLPRKLPMGRTVELAMRDGGTVEGVLVGVDAGGRSFEIQNPDGASAALVRTVPLDSVEVLQWRRTPSAGDVVATGFIFAILALYRALPSY